MTHASSTRPGIAPALSLAARLAAARIVAVVTVEQPEVAAALAAALGAGGIGAVELTLRTPAALDALRAMRLAAPGLLLGAGTVLTAAQAEAVKAAGADFALAPGFDLATVRRSGEIGLPFVPGVATDSDIQAALGAGCRLLKFFPAEPLGGVRGPAHPGGAVRASGSALSPSGWNRPREDSRVSRRAGRGGSGRIVDRAP